ncbi:MAG: adenylate/guanylate cyclase domain-containing protein [Bacteroidota bacterium]
MKISTVTLFVLFLFSYSTGFSQDKQLDSLLKVLEGAKKDTGKVNTLNLISKKYFQTDPEKSVFYGLQSSALAKELNFKKGLAFAYKNTGIGYFNQGKYIDALKQYELSLATFQSSNDKKGVANIYSNMGNIYYNQGDDEKALSLYLNALKFSEEIKDTLRMVTALINVGAIYGKKEQTYDKAIQYYRLAYPLSLGLHDNSTIGITAVNLGEAYMMKNNKDSTKHYADSALHYYNVSLKVVEGTEDAPYTMNDIGALYMFQKKYDKAIEIQQQAIELAKKIDAKNDLSISLVGLAQSYQAKGDLKKAREIFSEAESLATELDANYTLQDVYKGLSDVYADQHDFQNATKYQGLLLAIKDSIYNLETDKKLGTLQFTFDLEKKETQINLLTKDQEIKEKEISRQKLVRNGFVGGFAIVLLFAGVFFTQRNRISKEKKRSDELLLNILPEETAEELKQTGAAKAKSFDLVTVMFTDFKNFTQASEKLSAEELVEEINYCFSEFDRIITKHGIEKIKTIGDAYMCVSGLPATNSTHPEDVIKAGLEMQAFIAKNKAERQARNQIFFELRLGIHTGPVVAGIVGIKKFAYDIWGDTVNTASRMESSGETGKVNISGTTYDLVKDKFKCAHRGKIAAKNKGDIDMYFVEGSL